MAQPERVILTREVIRADHEVHVLYVDVPEDGVYVDIREFIPSLDRYGRGLTLPVRLVNTLLDGIAQAKAQHSG